MYPHHKESIEKLSDKLYKREDVLGLIIGGSIAHGFAREHSDIDIMIVLPEDLYQQRLQAGDLQYGEEECCTYENGYVDGKYISESYMEKVSRFGSEPARFAFQDAFVAFSKIDGLENRIRSASKYPSETKKDNIGRFYAQFGAWKWYCDEAIKGNHLHLLNYSITQLVLFGGRLLLAYNETLYPYHKWFQRVLEQLPEKPEKFIQNMERCYIFRDVPSIEAFYDCIEGYQNWKLLGSAHPSQFILDAELNWLEKAAPVSDL